MIITTSQEQALVSECGCPCPPPACGATRMQCESITVPICGFALPSHPDVLPEEACKRYATRVAEDKESYDWTGTTFVDFVEVPTEERGDLTFTYTRTKEVVDGVCVESYVGQDRSYSYVLVTLLDGRKWPESEETYLTTRSSLAACSGTYSGFTTYELDPPDPGDTTTWNDPYDGACTAEDLVVDNTWTRTGLVFTKTIYSETYVMDPDGKIGWMKRELKVTYADEVSGEVLDAQLAALTFPDDKNGEFCTSIRACDTLRKVRYQVAPLEEYSTPDNPRSYFEAQWDEGMFPADWTQWVADKAAFDASTAVHDAWVANGSVPPEPVITADPGAEPAKPSLLASRSYTWSGTMEEPGVWGGWITLMLPSVDGEIRVVNMMTKCHRSTRLGVKPTAHGEVFEFDAEAIPPPETIPSPDPGNVLAFMDGDTTINLSNGDFVQVSDTYANA